MKSVLHKKQERGETSKSSFKMVFQSDSIIIAKTLINNRK